MDPAAAAPASGGPVPPVRYHRRSGLLLVRRGHVCRGAVPRSLRRRLSGLRDRSLDELADEPALDLPPFRPWRDAPPMAVLPGSERARRQPQPGNQLHAHGHRAVLPGPSRPAADGRHSGRHVLQLHRLPQGWCSDDGGGQQDRGADPLPERASRHWRRGGVLPRQPSSSSHPRLRQQLAGRHDTGGPGRRCRDRAGAPAGQGPCRAADVRRCRGRHLRARRWRRHLRCGRRAGDGDAAPGRAPGHGHRHAGWERRGWRIAPATGPATAC